MSRLVILDFLILCGALELFFHPRTARTGSGRAGRGVCADAAGEGQFGTHPIFDIEVTR